MTAAGIPALLQPIQERWHAEDCGGTCDGCGYIAEDGLWYAGPTPEHLKERQAEYAE